MKAPLYDKLGKQKGTVDLEASHFGITPNMGLLSIVFLSFNKQMLVSQFAHTKHRGEVAGSTKKCSNKRELVMLVWVIVVLQCVEVEVSYLDLAILETTQFHYECSGASSRSSFTSLYKGNKQNC
jgi:hypothetical protein